PLRNRPLIAHLAYSQYIHMAPEKEAAMLDLADLLLDAGADPNDGVPSEPGPEHRLSMLYGALGHANNLALAERLLERGATPDDNESLYHATELPTADGLRLLIRYNVRISGTNALPRALDFDDAEKVRLLLEAGANPNEAVQAHPSGQPIDTIPALHQAARRWCSAEVVRTLLKHGADPAPAWMGLSAYETARVFGNDAAAAVLEASGHSHALSPDIDLLAACVDGTPPKRRLERERLPQELQRLPVEIAGRPGRLAHLQALILAGLDPNQTNDMGLTPLHVAAWEGVAEHVRYFLTLSPDLAHKNAYGGDALGTAIHGAEFSPHRAERDHIACAALLLAAGAALDPRQAAATGNEAMALFLSEQRGESVG
ncbi:MAG: ankyrin repeat domain-containing protein, partial [Pseudomonadota bacterium]